MNKLLFSPSLIYRIPRHIILFLSMVFLFTWVTASGAGEEKGFLDNFILVLTNAFIFFGYAYLTVYLFIPVFLFKRKIVLFILVFLITGILLSLAKLFISDYIFFLALSPESAVDLDKTLWPGILVNTKDMTFIVALFALVKFAKDHYLLSANIRELEKNNLEAEIRLLEHHLDPHVLFNNFNNLYSISINKPEILKSTIGKLKAILHYLFSQSKTEPVPLSTEIGMIENYIGLEKLRFGNRLNIDFSVNGRFPGIKIAPLILYSFVENCFEFGAGELPDNSRISIRLTLEENRIHFYALHSIPEFVSADYCHEKEIMNNNHVRRLELLYPNNHRLTIREKRDVHEVDLNIKI